MASLSRFLIRFSSSFSGRDTCGCRDLFWLLTSVSVVPGAVRSKPINILLGQHSHLAWVVPPPSDTGHRVQPQPRCQEAYFLEDYERKRLIRGSVTAAAKCARTRTGKMFTL